MTKKLNGLFQITVLILCLAGLSGCNLDAIKDTFNRIKELCHGVKLDDFKSARLGEVSRKCKESLKEHLPEIRTNFFNKILPLGIRMYDGKPTLFLHGIGSDEIALKLTDFRKAKIKLYVNGQEKILHGSDFTARKLKERAERVMKVSIVTDLAGPTVQRELDSLKNIHRVLLKSLPTHDLEAELIDVASQNLVKKHFTGDIEAVLDKIPEKVVTEIEKWTPAEKVIEGLETAISHLEKEQDSLRMVVLSTSGWVGEMNEEMIQRVESLVREHDVKVVVVGAFGADTEVLERLAGADGVYIYSKDYSHLEGKIAPLVHSLEESVELEADIPLEGKPERVVVEISQD